MCNGIMPYGATPYVYGTPTPYMTQPYVMQQDACVTQPKKHSLTKLVGSAACFGATALAAYHLVKNPEKGSKAIDTIVDYSKRGLDFIQEKGKVALDFIQEKGKVAIDFISEKGGKFFEDVKQGAIKLYNKIFNKG